jgi:GH25 family lysozyme M1 (1,4-beta-N-acetylmuramidase)
MKQYLVFAGFFDTEINEWEDFLKDVDTLEEANACVIDHIDNYDWFQIVDADTKQVIREWCE